MCSSESSHTTSTVVVPAPECVRFSVEVENQLTREYLSKKKMNDNVEEETTHVSLMYKSGNEKESCDTEDILKSSNVNNWIIEAKKTPTKSKHLDSKQRLSVTPIKLRKLDSSPLDIESIKYSEKFKLVGNSSEQSGYIEADTNQSTELQLYNLSAIECNNEVNKIEKSGSAADLTSSDDDTSLSIIKQRLESRMDKIHASSKNFKNTLNSASSVTSAHQDSRKRRSTINKRFATDESINQDQLSLSCTPSVYLKRKSLRNKTRRENQCEEMPQTMESSDESIFREPRRVRRSKVPEKSQNNEDAYYSSPVTKLSDVPSTPITPVSIKKTNSLKQKARFALHPTNVPDLIPCREEEFDGIYDFMKTQIRLKDREILFIYGPSGVGKTTTIERVVKKLKVEAEQGKIDSFEYVTLNGSYLKSPKEMYSSVWKILSHESISIEKAKLKLRERFTNKQTSNKQRRTLLVIDEFDSFLGGKNEVFYEILEWSMLSELILVTVTSTRDVFDKFITNENKKIGTRMSNARYMPFEAYTCQQLETIIEDRLNRAQANAVFSHEAIELLARKSSESDGGDARKALNLCRQVLSYQDESNKNDIVSILDVTKALDEIYLSYTVRYIKSLPKWEKYAMRAIRDIFIETKKKDFWFNDRLCHQVDSICALENSRKIPFRELGIIMHRFVDSGFIKPKNGIINYNREFYLMVDVKDLQSAL